MIEKEISIYNLIDFIETIYKGVLSIEIDLRAKSALLRTFSKESSYYTIEKLKSFVGAENALISNVKAINGEYDGYLTFYITWKNEIKQISI